MTLWKFLDSAAKESPDSVAVIDGADRFTYAAVLDRCRRLASFLGLRGLGRGDRFATLEWNTHRHLEAYFAAAGLGAVLVPLNWRLSASELAFALKDSGARWILASPHLASLVAEIRELEPSMDGILWADSEMPRGIDHGMPYEAALKEVEPAVMPTDVEPSEIAQIYYTSGTTGRQKGVILTHANVATHARSVVTELSLSAKDVWAHIAPMFHLADAWATFAITLVHGRHVMVRKFEPEAAIRTIERERVTLSNLVPSMLNAMVKHPASTGRDYSKLRVILSGGAPIAPDLVRRILQTFRCDYIQTYGMTETSPYLTLGILKPHLAALPPSEQLVWKAKTGRPFLGIDLKIVREDGTPVAADGKEVGEILVRGETVTPGYWNLPQETALAFADGWLRTGDLAVLDHEGYVNIVDRKKDVINTGGEKVYSVEVENAIYEHPAVLEAAAFGRPDETWGEAVTAAVVLRPGMKLSEEAMLQHCRVRLAGFKVPKHIEFLAELPKTGSGKVQKKVLRDRSRAT